MNYRQFRQEEGLRLEMATWLRSPLGQIVIAILKDGARPKDVPAGTEALASARYLSQLSGYQACIDDFLSLGEPLSKDAELPPPQWGADEERGDQYPLQANLAKMKEIQDARDRIRDAAADAAAARNNS